MNIEKHLKQEATKQEILRAYWRENPVNFSQSFFGSTLWSKQQEVMCAVRDYSRVAVKSGNTVGKTRDAAEIVLWFLLSHKPSKVITTAPTFTQVEEILWKEIASLYHKAKAPIGGDLLKTQLKFNADHFALGISTNEVNRFQGFHSAHLLIVIDEALGVAPEIWEAVESLHAYRVLALGNPLTPEGDFYNCFSSPLWHKITISCRDCIDWQHENEIIPGLVTQQWVDERKDEWGEKSPLYQARVLGEFPQGGDDTLIPYKDVERAREIELEEEEDAIRVEACDVARSGRSKTVIISRIGHTFHGIVVEGDTTVPKTARMLKRNYLEHQADCLVVDDDGVGGGVTDILREQGIGVYAFHGGWKAKAIDSTRYKNLRSQCYWVVAKKFEKGLYSLKKLPQKEYEILKSQLCAIRMLPLDEMGRIRIETKEDMLARGLRSPDHADAVIMSEWGLWQEKIAEVKPYRWHF